MDFSHSLKSDFSPAYDSTATLIAAAQKPKAVASRDVDPSHRDAAISAYARADERVANANLPRINGLPSLFGGLFGLR